MDAVTELRAHLNTLHEAVWELAAIAVALRDPAAASTEQMLAVERVLVEAGLVAASAEGPAPARALADALGGSAAGLASQASTGILQAATLLSGAAGWSSQDDEAILAQGRTSAQLVEAFKVFAVPKLAGLGDLLAGPAPVMLDVGVGVGALAIAFCQAFPQLRVVGLDVFPRALVLGERAVREAGLADRIELRHQDVAHLDERDAFCLSWLPSPFVPRDALMAGLPRMVAALVRGGWLMVGHGKLGGSGLSAAVTRFQTVAFGGTALTDEEAQDLLRSVDLELVATLQTPQGAPNLTVGRRPPA